jgi:hypothetical protein
MIVDVASGFVTIRDAEVILGILNDLTVTPNQARMVAQNLINEGNHTVAAEGLMRAADQAEKERSDHADS